MAATAPKAKREDFASMVREHPRREDLATLCLESLQRQSLAQSGRASRKWLKGRARALGLEARQTDAGAHNLLDVLARPDAEAEALHTVGAFAIDGVGRALEGPEGADESLEALVRWLATDARYAAFDHASGLLSDEACDKLSTLLHDACVGEAGRSQPAAFGLMQALASLDGGGRRLSKLSASLDDPVLSACALAFAGVEPVAKTQAGTHAGPGVEGVWVSGRGIGPLRVLGWLSGVAFVARLLAAMAWLLRMQSRAHVSLDGRVVRLERRRSLLGRDSLVIDESLRVQDVRAVVWGLRHPVAVLWAGAAALVLGAVGLGLGIEAALASGRIAPVGWGLFVLGVGAGFDLLFDSVVRARGDWVWLEINAVDRPPLRLSRVDPAAAKAFVTQLDALR